MVGGYHCPADALPSPAAFRGFTAFKTRQMGLWGEMLVDVHFDGFKLADHHKAGMEFKYLNGRDSHFATTHITNALFVGSTSGVVETPESPKCRDRGNCQGPRPVGNASKGFFYPTPSSMGNGWTHAIHLPGIGSEAEVRNVSFHHYQGALFGCAWCVAHRGGYEMDFYNASFFDVEHVAHFKHGVGGIIRDMDGSLGSGAAGGTIVPPTGQWRTNSACRPDPSGRFTACRGQVRRVNVEINKWTSPWWNTAGKKKYPLITVTDVTEAELGPGWDTWRRYPDENNQACFGNGGCGLEHYSAPFGKMDCFEQVTRGEVVGQGWGAVKSLVQTQTRTYTTYCYSFLGFSTRFYRAPRPPRRCTRSWLWLGGVTSSPG